MSSFIGADRAGSCMSALCRSMSFRSLRLGVSFLLISEKDLIAWKSIYWGLLPWWMGNRSLLNWEIRRADTCANEVLSIYSNAASVSIAGNSIID